MSPKVHFLVILHVSYYKLIAISDFTKVLSFTIRENFGLFRTFVESGSQITFFLVST